MTSKGFVRGRTIEFEEPLPFPEGQPVNVTVLPVERADIPGSPAFARRMMHEAPHLEPGDIEALDRTLHEAE